MAAECAYGVLHFVLQAVAASQDTGWEVVLMAFGVVKSSAQPHANSKAHEHGMFVAPYETGLPGHRLAIYSSSTGGVLRDTGEQLCSIPGIRDNVPMPVRSLRAVKQNILQLAHLVSRGRHTVSKAFTNVASVVSVGPQLSCIV